MRSHNHGMIHVNVPCLLSFFFPSLSHFAGFLHFFFYFPSVQVAVVSLRADLVGRRRIGDGVPRTIGGALPLSPDDLQYLSAFGYSLFGLPSLGFFLLAFSLFSNASFDT